VEEINLDLDLDLDNSLSSSFSSTFSPSTYFFTPFNRINDEFSGRYAPIL
jgi:hypothetical protein